MKIQLTSDAICATVPIPKGEYTVALMSENHTINLVAGGRDIKLPAIRRRTQSRSRTTTISFYASGGQLWSLVVTTPKHGEWICTIEYDKSGRHKK